jgi:hypothetical protein
MRPTAQVIVAGKSYPTGRPELVLVLVELVLELVEPLEELLELLVDDVLAELDEDDELVDVLEPPEPPHAPANTANDASRSATRPAENREVMATSWGGVCGARATWRTNGPPGE